jgi:hypothetical protein
MEAIVGKRRAGPVVEIRCSGSMRYVEVEKNGTTTRARSVQFTYELGRAAGVIHEQLDLDARRLRRQGHGQDEPRERARRGARGKGMRFAGHRSDGRLVGAAPRRRRQGRRVEVLILGGIHGDLPIEPTAGAVVADLVVDEDASVIIDISRRADGSMWSIAERVRFVTDVREAALPAPGREAPADHAGDRRGRAVRPQIVRSGESDVAPAWARSPCSSRKAATSASASRSSRSAARG